MSFENVRKIFIDASAFLGMHSGDEELRRASVNLFVKNFNSKVYMSLEQVGYCDDIIWRFPRKSQDQYYPFMDRLHTEMDIHRIPYTYEDIFLSFHNQELSSLATPLALVAAQVLNNDAVLYSHNKELLALSALNGRIGRFSGANELGFNKSLDSHYKKSQVIKVNREELNYA
ncbi:MAG: DUF6190 family protein [Gammaproteobacteria bacterium]|jgi:hypothetical protein|nr:DUF6190 family protein [Gammaproteobacteria bacterium]